MNNGGRSADCSIRLKQRRLPQFLATASNRSSPVGARVVVSTVPGNHSPIALSGDRVKAPAIDTTVLLVDDEQMVADVFT